jgi:hypothetical protein
MTGQCSSRQVSAAHDRSVQPMTGQCSPWQVSAAHDRSVQLMTGQCNSWQVSATHDRSVQLMTGQCSPWQVSAVHDSSVQLTTGQCSPWQVSAAHDTQSHILKVLFNNISTYEIELCIKLYLGLNILAWSKLSHDSLEKLTHKKVRHIFVYASKVIIDRDWREIFNSAHAECHKQNAISEDFQKRKICFLL